MTTSRRYASLWFEIHTCIPAKDYLAPNGCLNIASYMPDGDAKPDLGNRFLNRKRFGLFNLCSPGPKWYIAHRDASGCGSTVLHADASDAWNLIISGRAEWIIFRRGDGPGLTLWLKTNAKASHGSKYGSHIHQQETFLTKDDLAKLERDTGIRPFVFSQTAGQMVIIPSGCAHQVSSTTLVVQRDADSQKVSNQEDSIKVACDFIHPASIPTCLGLTKDFRLENIDEKKDAWKADILKVKLTTMYAFQEINRLLRESQENILSAPKSLTALPSFKVPKPDQEVSGRVRFDFQY